MAVSAPVAVIDLNPFGDGLEDPAQQVLLITEEAKKKRKAEETKIELEKIQNRIEYALHGFETPTPLIERPSEMNFELIEDPVQLYDLLADSRVRARYKQNLTVFIVGVEEQREAREQLLRSLQEFFQEIQAGNMEQLIEEIAGDEINFDEATEGLESALRTAELAADRLLEIRREMGQLFSIVTTFPDTKKGRKKLEKALLKAQEEVQTLAGSLQAVQKELEESKEKCTQLHRLVEGKTAECNKLKKTAEQMNKLEATNASLRSELSSISTALTQAKANLEKANAHSAKTEVVREEVVRVDEGRVKELEQILGREKEAYQQLLAEKNDLEAAHASEISSMQTEHEALVEEMRGRYEEQLKSLMVEEDFDEFGEEEGEDQGSLAASERLAGSEDADIDSEMVDVGTAKPLEPTLAQSANASGGLSSRSAAGRLQMELKEVKARSKKTVTALRAQLVDTQNKNLLVVTSKDKEIAELKDLKQKLQDKVSSLEEAVASSEEGRKEAEEGFRARQQEQEMLVNQLRHQLVAATQAEQTQQTPVHLVNRSAQWTEVSGQSTPRYVGASSLAIPMDEVLHTPSLQQTPLYGSHAFLSGPAQPMASLQQSMVSIEPPLGSPMEAGERELPQLPTHHSLRMLAQSQLSHNQQHLSPDHHIVSEWVKAYELVMKFKDSIVEMLEEHENLKSIAEDLRLVDVHSLDRSQDVQGQITEMRFSLALTVHQMEQALWQSFARGLHEEEEDEGVKRVGGSGEGDGMKDKLTVLKHRLKQAEHTHKIELEESKDTIANLSNRVESLKMEVASLQHHLPTAEQGERKGAIMFTRLDSQHNTRRLKEALEEERISPSTYQHVSSRMQEYLSIPSERLAQLTKQYSKKIVAERIMADRPEVCGAVKMMEGKRMQQWTQGMAQLSARRVELATSLTKTLSRIETAAGVFLIKPIYTRGLRTRSLITPLSRPLPTHHRPSRPRSSSHSGRSTPHPSMRLVMQSRQSARNAAVDRPITSSSIDGEGSPLLRRGKEEDGPAEWRVGASRPSDNASPLVFKPTPTLPRMVELEFTRHRQPEALLARLLPTKPPSGSPPTHMLSPSTLDTHIHTSPLPPLRVPSRADHPLTV